MSGDTIVALSSGRLPAGIAVIRISGEQTRAVVGKVAGVVPPARLAVRACFRSADGAIVDRGLLLFFERPRSFTGEDVAELHLHGGKAVVAAALEELCSFPGIRMAEAGEFTRRAFLNGKTDLLRAEALADLIAAETEGQRRFALMNEGGAQLELYGGWRSRLLESRALLEAELDFSDEADVPGAVAVQIWSGLEHLASEIERHAGSFRRAEIIRDGLDVLIMGAPNAGKSSLLNALARREVAIVSDEPGTTRDLVEVALDVDGLKVRLTDTAGLREGAEKVEAVGIARARERAKAADVILHLTDLTQPVDEDVGTSRVLWIGTKADLAPESQFPVQLRVSSLTGEGLPELTALLSRQAQAATNNEVLPSRVRHVDLLLQAVMDIRGGIAAKMSGAELAAEHLRRAANSLGKISGAVDVEDMLDVIFSRFCIGK